MGESSAGSATSLSRIALAVPAILALLAAGSACSSFSEDTTGSQADAATDGAGTEAAVADAGPDASAIGCSDGTREGYLTGRVGLAACEGAWLVPGVLADAPPRCERAGGNDGVRSDGVGCSAADLCAIGWHVCRDALDVSTHGGAAIGEICTSGPTADGVTFFATAQPSERESVCDAPSPTAFNDLLGCGDSPQLLTNCAPLNAIASAAQPAAGFVMGVNTTEERKNVVKAPGKGGVLCCRD